MRQQPQVPPPAALWPSLPAAAWQETYATLHLWTQIVGKIRLALAPPENHWWQVPLYVTPRGLTTSPMPYGGQTLAINFDLIDHALVIETSTGRVQVLPLAPRTVAAFYAEVQAALRALDIDVPIWTCPVEIADPIRFERDQDHRAYDAAAVEQFRRLLVQADRVLKEFRGRFLGKCSPVHFFWGSFDLAVTRFSGRPAPPHPGAPHVADLVTREAYSHEVSSCGWWPGGGPVPGPAFYAYAYPEPPGFGDRVIRPDGAYYDPALREFLLPVDVVRSAASPDAAVLQFLQSTYEAAADLGRWDRAALERAA